MLYAVLVPAILNGFPNILTWKAILVVFIPSIFFVTLLILSCRKNVERNPYKTHVVKCFIADILMLSPIWIMLILLCLNSDYELMKMIANITGSFGSVLLGLGVNILYKKEIEAK